MALSVDKTSLYHFMMLQSSCYTSENLCYIGPNSVLYLMYDTYFDSSAQTPSPPRCVRPPILRLQHMNLWRMDASSLNGQWVQVSLEGR